MRILTTKTRFYWFGTVREVTSEIKRLSRQYQLLSDLIREHQH